MNIVILAAGGGARLKPYTKKTPKCLVNVAGHPILEWQLEQIKYFKPKNVYIVIGYQADMIKEWVRKQEYDLNIIFVENPNYANSNNLYSLRLCGTRLVAPCIIINGDVVFHRDVLKALYNVNGNAIATVRKELDDDDMKVAILNSSPIYLNKVVDTSVSFDSLEQALGLYRIEDTAQLATKMTELPDNEYFNTAISNMLPECRFSIVDVTSYPAIEIDFPEDLERASDMFYWNVKEWDIGIRHNRPLNEKSALKLLSDFKNVLEEAKIPWFVCFGTALGFYRDGKFIPHDTDMDIGIYLEDKERFIACEEKLRKLGCYVPFVDNFYYDRWVIRDSEKIEVHCFEKVGNERIYDIYRCGFRFPAKIIDNLTTVSVYDMQIPIPSDTNAFMALSYGSDWRTPRGSLENHVNTSQIKRKVKTKYFYVDKFDPLTLADVNLLAKMHTPTCISLILVNSDKYLWDKKEFPLLQREDERFNIVRHLRFVELIAKADDSDGTVREQLAAFRPDYYIVKKEINPLELAVCEQLHIKVITVEEFLKQEV